MADVVVNAERFFERLARLQAHWKAHKSEYWKGADVLCITAGTAEADATYSKVASLQLYLLGYEFSDTIILITPKSVHVMATPKKCTMLEVLTAVENSPATVHLIKKEKDEGVNRENFHNLLSVVRKTGKNIGSLLKQEYAGAFAQSWMELVKSSTIDMVDITDGMGIFFAVKDEAEQDLCKRAAVLTNKVMKHGFVAEMEGILDADLKTKHVDLAQTVEGIIYDPSKIGVKIAADVVEICYAPIVQSGGKYDIKVSAESNNDLMSPDIIICSLGARYKSYCANLSRTFMVDAPPKVEKTYGVLIALYNACLEQMIPGHELKDVYESAKKFLATRDAALVNHLPKSLGFAIGLEFRDPTLVINEKTSHKFSDGMVFTLSVGFHNVPLTPEDKAKATDAYKKMSAFSLLIADTVRVQAAGVPEILTKAPKEFMDVSYNISDKKDDDEDDDEEEDEEDEGKGRGGRKAREEGGPRRSGRREQEREVAEGAAMKRAQMQHDLMKKRIKDAQLRLEKGQGPRIDKEEEEEKEAQEVRAYKSPNEYPRDVVPTQVKVDMEKEALLVPINGRSVPFHISMVKNITMPEQDRATWLRINFYAPGTAMGKDVAKNVQQLVAKVRASLRCSSILTTTTVARSPVLFPWFPP
jgi:nucleosome binding factor SPN SPT16 subunit